MAATTLKTGRPAGLPRRPKPQELIPHIRELAESLTHTTPAELCSEADSLRNAIARGRLIDAPEILIAGCALMVEAVRRGHHVDLYDVQLLAVVHLVQGRVVQMQTGEGKTFAAIATAGVMGLHGRGVHVMTPNAYLAERDREKAEAALSHLAMSVGLTPERGEPAEKRLAYDCDVTYGTGHEFGFDYLRDQLILRESAKAPLGSDILRRLRSATEPDRDTIQRGLVYAVVDEADNVMFDDAASPLVLSMAAAGEAPDSAAHLLARDMADDLERDRDFSIEESTGYLQLTSPGADRCYADDVDIPVSVLLRPWTSYVEQALRAKYLFRRDVHYVVRDGEVRIVDQSTGRIFEDRSWQDGLHQAIEAREGLPVTPEKESLARISRQRFFRLYENLCGMTGTAVGCEQEFQRVYRCRVADIPLHRPSARELLPTRFFVSRTAKLTGIAEEVMRRHHAGQPVLIGTQSIHDSEVLAEQLRAAGCPFELLNGLQTKEEAEIVSLAGRPGAVTIATNLAGRGTDILVPPDAEELGGLHVIAAECQLSGRMDRQLIGRAGRQGQRGSAQIFVSAEDALITRFGAWLGRAIRREAGECSETEADFTGPLMKLQRAAEKQQFLARMNLLREDIATDSLFGRT